MICWVLKYPDIRKHACLHSEMWVQEIQKFQDRTIQIVWLGERCHDAAHYISNHLFDRNWKKQACSLPEISTFHTLKFSIICHSDSKLMSDLETASELVLVRRVWIPDTLFYSFSSGFYNQTTAIASVVLNYHTHILCWWWMF